ncbi:MAG: hypothetical protein LRY40_01030 [Shewanella fodinae]|nr:hypothetical protein [Shewanella fodinae]
MKLIRKMGVIGAIAAVCVSSAVWAAPKFINILTGGTSGVYYPLGVALSQIYGNHIDGAKTLSRPLKLQWKT